MFALKDYQEEAVRKLTNTANGLLELEGSKTIVFKAPTGSGKTVMMAEFLKQLVEHHFDSKTFAFIWTAPRQLHEQSKAKLEKYYFDSKALRCMCFEDLANTQIGENEILFLNWESINKADNIYIRDNERDFNLSSVIANTLDAGRTIILVIDESHHSAKTETSLELINMLQPKITLEVSATPNIQGDEQVTAYRQKVITEGMIKKRIAINPDFSNQIARQTAQELKVTSSAAESANEFVLQMALRKRVQLAQKLAAAGSSVNPLMLIQLPDKRRGVADIKDEIVKILKDNHNITPENGKLAIYLSEDKTNLENITRKDSEAEVMIFKQAIALGWDCPRAAILALFRDWQSFTFSIQTLGRILRMPELKHYADDELNTGFVYTNLSDFAIQEDMVGDYLTIQHATRKESYQPIELRSVYSKRFREITRLGPQFIHDFLQAADQLTLQDTIDINVANTHAKLISDGTVRDIDLQFAHIGEGTQSNGYSADIIEHIHTPMEAQRAFDLFVREQLAPFAPEQRSIGRVKSAIYRFFQRNYFMQFNYRGAKAKAQMVVLASENRQHFIDAINRAKEIYQAHVSQRQKELETVESWEVPPSYNYNHRYIPRQTKRCIFEPFHEVNDASQIERDFADYLDTTMKNVEWWFKNGDQDATFFAVPYEETGRPKAFYVDWIVKFSDGRIGLFDTKAGITAKTAKSRAKGLRKYIEEENKKGKRLIGGIVVWANGSWRVSKKGEYSYNEDDLSGWEFL